jgi:hypothetical protein
MIDAATQLRAVRGRANACRFAAQQGTVIARTAIRVLNGRLSAGHSLERPPHLSGTRMPSKKILVVDDNASIRFVIRSCLRLQVLPSAVKQQMGLVPQPGPPAPYVFYAKDRLIGLRPGGGDRAEIIRNSDDTVGWIHLHGHVARRITK